MELSQRHGDMALEMPDKSNLEIALELSDKNDPGISLELIKKNDLDISLADKNDLGISLEVTKKNDLEISLADKDDLDISLEVTKKNDLEISLELPNKNDLECSLELPNKNNLYIKKVPDKNDLGITFELINKNDLDISLELADKNDLGISLGLTKKNDLDSSLKLEYKNELEIIELEDKTGLYECITVDVQGCSRLEQNRKKQGISISDSDYRLLEALDLSEIRRHRLIGRFLSLPPHRLLKQPYKCEDKYNSILVYDLYTEQTKRLLCKVGQWDFSAFALHNMTSGRPIIYLCNYLFQKYGLVEHFRLDYVKMMKCFSLIEDGYRGNNPYHNVVHAADVTQAMHCYLQEGTIAQYCSHTEIMSALLAAACHDVDHPGVNQAFLIATSNHLASLYNNSSVLENHHWRLAVTALHESGIFNHLDLNERSTIEDQIKSLILATDITRQNEFLTKFKRHLDEEDLNMSDKEHRHLILQIAIKCADISNPCRPWELSKRWSEKICEEFFHQGDLERHLKLPVTPLCDRFLTSVAKIQSGFLQFVVLPLFQEWKRFLPTTLSFHMLQNVEDNRVSWEAIILTMNESQKKMYPTQNSISDKESTSEEEVWLEPS